MIKQRILEDLQKAINDLGFPTTDPDSIGTDIVCSIPKNPNFGDYSTNLALQLAKLDSGSGKQSADEIANKIVDRLQRVPEGEGYSNQYLEKIEVAGGGFINFFLKDNELLKYIIFDQKSTTNKGKKILVEYGHTNPLKEVHIGHLRTFILGESLSRILESVGNTVFRANYQGDIGLHIAKAIWGIEKLGLPVRQAGLPSKELTLENKAEFMGRSYAEGNKAYEDDPGIKTEIDKINTALYQKDPKFTKVYQLARSWSLQYFEPIYQLLGIKYDRCFFESEVFERGKEIVLANINKVFIESDGAIIFPGEKYTRLPDGQGLHNRVFITSVGNPTYEAKEIGLAQLEYSTFKYDKAIHVVAHEQAGYFQVVFKAIEIVFPKLKDKKYHLSYGLVNLKEGKMSSRTGSVITVDDLYKVVSEKVREVMKRNKRDIDQEVVKQVAVGAIKFTYLKFSPSPNMVFDLEESVSLEGDSGPYVQYTYARIQSVLRNALSNLGDLSNLSVLSSDKEERWLLRQLLYFPEILLETASTYHPNLLTAYLIDLAKLYNLFYQKYRIIGSDKAQFRLKLSSKVGEILKIGLDLLGIEAPNHM